MRYTKSLQNSVCSELEKGTTASECAAKFNIPQDVVIRWGNLDVTEERAKEIALRKYIEEVETAEDRITSNMSPVLSEDITDRKWFELCKGVQAELLELTAKVVKKERKLNPDATASKSDEQIIDDIVNKWKDNPFLPYYQNIGRNFEGAALEKIRDETRLG